MIPDYWIKFIKENNIVKKSFEIPENKDLSGLGAEIEIFGKDDISEESTDFYPGIAVKQFGYLPIGSCISGSGDPYFINTTEGVNGKLYRVLHEGGTEDDFDLKEGIETVLNNYQELLKYSDS